MAAGQPGLGWFSLGSAGIGSRLLFGFRFAPCLFYLDQQLPRTCSAPRQEHKCLPACTGTFQTSAGVISANFLLAEARHMVTPRVGAEAGSTHPDTMARVQLEGGEGKLGLIILSVKVSLSLSFLNNLLQEKSLHFPVLIIKGIWIQCGKFQ